MQTLSGVPLEGWTVESTGDGDYVVSGPCPACRGGSFGPSLPLEDVTATVALSVEGPAQPMVEILAKCQCGYTHGKDDVTNCGRRWTVVVFPEEPS